MAKFKLPKKSGLSIGLLIFSLLVLASGAYFLTTGKELFFQSGAAAVKSIIYKKPVSKPVLRKTPTPTPKPKSTACAVGYHCAGTKTINLLDGCSTLNPNTGAPNYACHQHSHPLTVSCDSNCVYRLYGTPNIMCNTSSCTEYSGSTPSGNCCVRN